MSIEERFGFNEEATDDIYSGCEVILAEGPLSDSELELRLIGDRWIRLPGGTVGLYLTRLTEMGFLEYDKSTYSYSLAQ